MEKMGRKPWYDKNGMKKGAWSKEEDDKLKSYIQKYGHSNWRQLPKFAGLSRCGKSCRLRWLNYLRQNIKRGNFGKQEEDLIMKLREEHGNKWAVIATKLPGRTDNEIKNYWHSKLKKVPIKQESSSSSSSNIVKNSYENPVLDASHTQSAPSSDSSSNGVYLPESDYSLLSDDKGNNNISSTKSYSEPISDFWTEPFLPDNTYSHNDFQSSRLRGLLSSSTVLYLDDDIWFYDQILMH